MKDCVHCNREIANNARSCKYCGVEVGAKQEPHHVVHGTAFLRFAKAVSFFAAFLLIVRIIGVPAVSFVGNKTASMGAAYGRYLDNKEYKKKIREQEARMKVVEREEVEKEESLARPEIKQVNFAKTRVPTTVKPSAEVASIPVERRNSKNVNECADNLRSIESAKTLWHLDTGAEASKKAEWKDLVPGYLAKKPYCPNRGKYSIGNSYFEASCSGCGKAGNPVLYTADKEAFKSVFKSASIKYVKCPQCKAEIGRKELERSIRMGKANCPFCDTHLN